MTIIEQIKNRISKTEDGEILLTSDFNDITSSTTARKCLSRCADENIIKEYLMVFIKSQNIVICLKNIY